MSQIRQKILLALLFLNPVLLFQNCGLGRPAEVADLASSSFRFQAAKEVLSRNCTSCHATGTSTNLSMANEQDFVTAGLVVAGDVNLSKLINRIQNYAGSATSARNMPPSGRISDKDFKILVDWVNGFGSTSTACAPQENLLKPQIKRLTRNQYINSVQQAFGRTFSGNQLPTLNDGNPRIGLAGDPDRLNVTDININSFYDSAVQISSTVRTSATDVLNCVNAATDSCYSTVISTYAPRLWRRTLTAAESIDLQAGLTQMTSANRAQKMDYILMSLILSPNHMFRTELGAGTGAPSGQFQMTQFEVASLLSFAMWDGPPDTTLFGLAQSGQLGTVTAIKAQVTRLAVDPKFKGNLSNFIVELLKIEDVRTIDKDPVFNLTGTERESLYSSAQQTLSASYVDSSSNLFAPFHTRQFHANQNTARFMNIGTGGLTANFTPVNMSPIERYGIMSHPAFLAAMSGRTASGIVKRGTFTLEQLLCYHMQPAPADIAEVTTLPPGFDRNLVTTREELHVTHSSQSRCVGCHAVIDPTGSAFENFNALGQFRITEKAANIPIDSSGRISGATRQDIAFNDSVHFFQQIAANTDFQGCVQKHLFKYLSGQDANSGPGRCEYQNFERNLNSKDQSIQSVLESLVELDSFTRRRAQ